MCVEYVNVKSNQRLIAHFGVELLAIDFKLSVLPLDLAPMIRRPKEGTDGASERECVTANFGLIPHWAKDTKIARKTYNARSETVTEKPSYRNAWRRSQFCIVPMDAFYEPNWETGKAVRWRIGFASGEPFGVAGIWEWWPGAGKEPMLSFSLLTINADTHPLMQRFHGPEDEKRMLVVLEPSRFDDWLGASPADATDFFIPCSADLMSASPDPWPAKARPPVPKPRPRAADA